MSIAEALANLALSEEDAGTPLKRRLQAAFRALQGASSEEDQLEFVNSMKENDFSLVKHLAEQLKTAGDISTRMLLLQLFSATTDILGDQGVCDKIIEGGAFPIVVAEAMTGKDEGVVTLAMSLGAMLSEKVRPLPLVSRALLDHGCITRLLDILDEPHEDENTNKETARFLLGVNCQYADAIEPECYSDSIFLRVLETHGNKSLFAGMVVSMLNRDENLDSVLLFLNHAFSYEGTAQTLFYTNDLQILLDVILRQLTDLPEDQLSTQTQFFEVLYPLFSNTTYTSLQYRQDDFIALLDRYSERLTDVTGRDPESQKLVARMGSYIMCTKALLEPKPKQTISLSRKPAGQLSLSRK